MSRAVIVHNHHAFGKLQSEFPQKRIQRIPHATPIRDLSQDMATLRSAYGFRKEDLILASVSSLAYNKRTQLVLSALQELRKDFPQVKFVVVGQGDLGSRSRALIRRFGLGQTVLQTGWVSSRAYLDYIDIADVIVDLRCPTAGETSGSSLRAMQAAKPLVVSAEGFFLELPDSCCLRLPVDGQETRVLRDILAGLIQEPERRKELGMAGRKYTLTFLRLEQAAKSYMEFVREVATSSYKPSRSWSFSGHGSSAVNGCLVSLAYRAGRLAYSLRCYGLAGTWYRIQSAGRSRSS